MIRDAVPADVPILVDLVRELADYEGAVERAQMTAGLLEQSLFCAEPRVFCSVAELDGSVVGTAIWFFNFSTWTGRHGIYLEDLYVRPHARKLGLGRALLAAVAAKAMEQGCPRLDWAVLDWNEPSIAFYRRVGAVHQADWEIFRLEGEALEALGRSGSGPGSRSTSGSGG